MTFGTSHAALLAEYQSLMDEENVLWEVISTQFAGVAGGAAGEQPVDADLERWAEVRRRRAKLDAVFESLVRSSVPAA